MAGEFATKLQRVRGHLSEAGLDGLLLSRLDNLFWLGCGLDAHVGLSTEAAAATALITSDRAVLATTNIEAPRLAAEELAASNFELTSVPWTAESPVAHLASLAKGLPRLAYDTPGQGGPTVDLSPLRCPLLPEEVAAYRALGLDHAASLGAAGRTCRPGQTELEIAARLSFELLSRGITPTVLLVAADHRIADFRHPVPTSQRAERGVLLVAGGRRRGLITSASRQIAFGLPGADLLHRHRCVCQVDAAFIGATRVGARIGDIMTAGLAAYQSVGFGEEWLLHHQGGPTGYAGRDYRATEGVNNLVRPWQAFAWNPSISGAKSEDTILATPDGPQILTVDPVWPAEEYEAHGFVVARPAILAL